MSATETPVRKPRPGVPGGDLDAPWQVIVLFAFLLSLVGVRIGSRTLPSIGEHKLFLQICPILGALGGFFLGIAAIHGMQAKGDFGWPVVACCALFAGLGLVLPFFVLSKFVPVRCPQCRGPAYLGTDSTDLLALRASDGKRLWSCESVRAFLRANIDSKTEPPCGD